MTADDPSPSRHEHHGGPCPECRSLGVTADDPSPSRSTEAGLARASHLLANYLHNEDGAQDEWLEEAYEIVARLASQPAPAVERLRALSEAATPGEWRASTSSASVNHTNSIEVGREALGPFTSVGWVVADFDQPWQRGVNGPPRRERLEAGANAELAAAAVNFVRAALAASQPVPARDETLRAAAERLDDASTGYLEAVSAYLDPQNQYTDSRLKAVTREAGAVVAALIDLRAALAHSEPAAPLDVEQLVEAFMQPWVWERYMRGGHVIDARRNAEKLARAVVAFLDGHPMTREELVADDH